MALVPVTQRQLPDGTFLLGGLGAGSGRRGGEDAPASIKSVKLPPGLKKKLLTQLRSSQSPYAKTWGPPVKYITIPRGEWGTISTLLVMKELVIGRWGHRNPEVILLAKKIVEGVSPGPSKDYRAMAQAILNFMKSPEMEFKPTKSVNMQYELDPAGLEWVQTPHYTLCVWGSGDCDDMATATCALGMALGFRAAFRTVKGDPGRPEQWSHVYPMLGFQTNGGDFTWVTLDATQKESYLGWDPPESKLFGMKTWVIDPRTSEEASEWDI